MTDILKLYFNDLKPFKATREENLVLLNKWKAGDMRAYDRLVRNFLPMVIKISKKYGSSQSSLEDLIASGNEYLLKGLTSFEESKGELAPYLTKWVEAGIIRFLKSDDTIRLPESQEYKRHGYYYLDQESDDERKFEIVEEVTEEVENGEVEKWLSSLDTRDRKIIELAFGIGCEKQHDSKEIAEIMGLTSVRVNQIFSKYSEHSIRKVTGEWFRNFK